jgi:hypothetical protein
VLSPQQASVPSLFIPQAESKPALIEVNVPAGGVEMSPQQARVPSLFTPQAKTAPALTVSPPLEPTDPQLPFEQAQAVSTNEYVQAPPPQVPVAS